MFPRFAVGLGYIVALLAVGLLILGVHFMSGTVPKYAGTASVTGISGPVQIDRDEYAIPHIHAANERDVYFGLGFAEAQDRLFQMEFTRRIGQGRLSELMGKKTFVIDAWAKTIGFQRLSEQMWSKASPHTKEILTSYVAGINQYIDGHRGQLGFEFDALKHVPEHWKPSDCLIVGRLMAWEMNFSYFTDAAFADIAMKLDSAHMRWLYPNYPEDGATVLEGADPGTFTSSLAALETTPLHSASTPVSTTGPTRATSSGTQPTATHGDGATSSQPSATPAIRSTSTGTATLRTTTPRTAPPSTPAPGPNTQRPTITPPRPRTPPPPPRTGSIGMPEGLFAALQEVQQTIDSVTGSHAGGGGSNSFALAPNRSATGGAILENDTHLELRAPARWYLAHLTSDDGINVAGFGIAGLPVVLSGRTPNVSWGITNAMADESDFFIEHLDTTGTRYIDRRGTPQKFQIIYDSILVQDSVKSNPLQRISYPVRMTEHGPIVSDLHPYRLTHTFNGNRNAGGIPDSSIFEHAQPVSLTWNGLFAVSDELDGWLRLPRAKTVGEARAGMTGFATPCLNLCMADAAGSIAYQYIGRMPRRSGSEERIMLPRDATNPADSWTGFVFLNELPSSVNPPRGYLVSANNPPTRNRAFAYSNNWEPSSRADRIADLIEHAGRLDTAGIKRIMTDIISPYDLKRVLPYLLALYPDAHPHHVSADSTSLYRLDSMKISWKQDSIRKNSTSPDSILQLSYVKDSLYLTTRHAAEDTVVHQKYDPFTTQVLMYLRNWDGGMRTQEIAPTIYTVFLQRLIENTFADELGSERYHEFIYLTNTPLRTLTRVLADSSNIWFDDVRTHGPVPESRDSILQKSFREALRILAQTFGRDIRTWQWGALHTLTYHHPFESAGKAIAQQVNIDVGAMPGGCTTVMQGSYYFWQPYAMRVGPSMRMVADMRSRVLLAALPTGNSEAVYGDNYRDMVDLFKRGDLVEIPLFDRKDNWKHFELQPR